MTLTFYAHYEPIGQARVRCGIVQFSDLPSDLAAWLAGHRVMLDGRIYTVADGNDYLHALACSLKPPYFWAVSSPEGSDSR